MIALNVCMKKIYICYFSLCFTGQKKRNGHTLKDKEAQKFNSIKRPEGHQIYLQKFMHDNNVQENLSCSPSLYS